MRYSAEKVPGYCAAICVEKSNRVAKIAIELPLDPRTEPVTGVRKIKSRNKKGCDELAVADCCVAANRSK